MRTPGEFTMQDERKTKAQLIAELNDLRRRETEYRALFRDSPQPMWIYDCATLAFLAVNDAAVGRYGYSRTEFLNMTIVDISLPAEVPLLLDVVRELPGPYRTPGVWSQRKKDGEVIDVEITTHEMVFSGKAARLVLANDVTVRQESKRLMQYQTALINHATEAIIAIDGDFKIEVWNAAAEQIYGWRAAEVLGQPIEHIIPGEFVETTAAAVRQQLEQYGHWRGEITQRRKDGSPVYVQASTAQLRDSEGRLFGAVTINHDITARKQAEEQLHFQAALLEKIHNAVIVVDAQMNIIYWNRHAETLYQWPVSEVMGRNLLPLLVRAEDVARVSQIIAAALPRGYWAGDFDLLRKDGSLVPVHISGAILKDTQGALLGIVGVSEDITEQKQLEAQRAEALAALRESETRLHHLSRQLLQVQEAERRALARELHDDIGQALTAVKLDLQTAQHTIDQAAIMQRLDDSLDTVEHALQAVRRLALDLRPLLLDDLGLAAALRWYVDRQAQRAGFTAQVDADLPSGHLWPEVETICFRVAQEALTNIVRYAHARRVSLRVWHTGSQLEMIIHDDGRGFNVDAARAQALRGESLGLLSMEERVVLGQGRLTIESAPEQGTTLRVWLPLPAGADG